MHCRGAQAAGDASDTRQELDAAAAKATTRRNVESSDDDEVSYSQ